MSEAALKIRINGWDAKLTINSLSLSQAYNQHHSFEFVANIPERHSLSVQDLRSILGEKADIQIIPKDSSKGRCHFIGFVDQVAPEWTPYGQALRVQGYSQSIFMDCTPRFRTFSEASLNTIYGKLKGSYSDLSFSHGNLSDKVDFSVQAQETDYCYLCRLADDYGKSFYYDGEQMYFGEMRNPPGEGAGLAWEEMVKSAQVSVNLAPLNFQLSGYELEKGAELSPIRCQVAGNSNELVKAAINKSGKYPAAPIFLSHLVKGETELKEISRRLLAKQANELIRLHGASDFAGLRIGKEINITKTDKMIEKGSYIVIAIQHSVGSDRSYRNTFIAIPAGFPYPIRMQTTSSPVTGPLLAVVHETDDPKDKLGRVKVKFTGDEMQSISPWLRVLTPYTGNSGMHFMPEKGDQVAVFMEDFNAEKQPFVMGAFYHGKANAERWYDPDNKKKGLQTQKSYLLIDDNNGKVTLMADEIELLASQRMTLKGGRHLTLSADRIDLNP